MPLVQVLVLVLQQVTWKLLQQAQQQVPGQELLMQLLVLVLTPVLLQLRGQAQRWHCWRLRSGQVKAVGQQCWALEFRLLVAS